MYIHRGVVAMGSEGGKGAMPPKFWAEGKLWKNFVLVGKYKLWGRKSQFWGNLAAKLKF